MKIDGIRAKGSQQMPSSLFSVLCHACIGWQIHLRMIVSATMNVVRSQLSAVLPMHVFLFFFRLIRFAFGLFIFLSSENPHIRGGKYISLFNVSVFLVAASLEFWISFSVAPLSLESWVDIIQVQVFSVREEIHIIEDAECGTRTVRRVVVATRLSPVQ